MAEISNKIALFIETSGIRIPNHEEVELFMEPLFGKNAVVSNIVQYLDVSET